MTRKPRFPVFPEAPLEVPTAQMDDEPQRCIEMNAQWLTYLMGMVERLAFDNRYELTTQEEHDHIFNQVQHLLQRFTDAVECVEQLTYTLDRVIVEDIRAQNTAGGSTVANTWTDLPYNTLSLDQTQEASLSSNVLTLPEGDWLIYADHAIRSDNDFNCRIRLFAGAALKTGTQHRPNIQSGVVPFVRYRLKVITTATIKVQYYTSDAFATNGLGNPMNVAGESEFYGQIVCERLHQVT